MIDVGRDDGAAARHLAPHEIRGQPFANRDELHLGRDLAFARVVQLRHARIRAPAADPGLAQLRQADLDVVALGAARVVDAERRLAARQRDLAHRHAHALRALDVDFS